MHKYSIFDDNICKECLNMTRFESSAQKRWHDVGILLCDRADNIQVILIGLGYFQLSFYIYLSTILHFTTELSRLFIAAIIKPTETIWCR
jgi:hypothetical protein